jgi:hypothetical protein
MGYLDNSSVIVDAILTKKGRELLSRQDGTFKITQFALADDEIDYTLYNENHPDGSAFYGEAIENLPLIEAIPNESNTMISKLVTLDRGTSKIPTLDTIQPIQKGKNGTFTITPETLNYDSTKETAYSFTVADRRLLAAAGATSAANTSAALTDIPFTGTSLSQTFIGTSFSGRFLNSNTLFGSNSALTTSLIVIGLETGARATVSLTVTKESGAGADAASQAQSTY